MKAVRRPSAGRLWTVQASPTTQHFSRSRSGDWDPTHHDTRLFGQFYVTTVQITGSARKSPLETPEICVVSVEFESSDCAKKARASGSAVYGGPVLCSEAAAIGMAGTGLPTPALLPAPASSPYNTCVTKLSKNELVVLWVGIGLIVLMGLFPPCLGSYYWEPGFFAWAGYHPLFRAVRIRYGRLIIQWLLVVIVTGAVIFTMRQARGGRQ